MTKLLPAFAALLLVPAAHAADRSLPANAGAVPTVTLPSVPTALPTGLRAPGMPAALPGAASTAGPSAAPAAAPKGAPAAEAAPAASAAGVKAAASPSGGAPQAAAPRAAAPSLESMAARVSAPGVDASASLSTGFDGARQERGCAHCAHAEDEVAGSGDGNVIPQDTAGNPFIVPGHLEPLLPSHVDPKTWTNSITLHLHSIFSDGTMTPEAVMDLAYSKGVRSVALSDHDTLAGVTRAWKRAKELGMEFHPAAELTARGGVHIGAVDVDVSNAQLVALVERVRVMRRAKAEGMIENLNALPELKAKGIVITIEEVMAKSQHEAGGTIEIPHIARVLVDKGLIQHVDDAYDKYLKGDVFKVPGVEQDPTVDEVLAAIKAAGGKAFLNHPYTVRGDDDAQKDAAIKDILDKGVDGIEVYRPSHATSPDGKKAADARAAKYLTWIDERGLLAGNGADFHGTDTHLDSLVVWMPKVLAQQLTDALKDVNARALDALERLDGQAAKKPGTPPAPVSGFALAPLAATGWQAFQFDASHPFPWTVLIPCAFMLGLGIVATSLGVLEKKSRGLADGLLAFFALGFACSLYAIVCAHFGIPLF